MHGDWHRVGYRSGLEHRSGAWRGGGEGGSLLGVQHFEGLKQGWEPYNQPPAAERGGGGGTGTGTDIGNQPHAEPLTVERSQEAVGIAGLLEQLLELAVLYSLSLIRACLLGGNE